MHFGADACKFESEFWGSWLAIVSIFSALKGQMLEFKVLSGGDRERGRQERTRRRQRRGDSQFRKGPSI